MLPPRCDLCGRKAVPESKLVFGGYQLVAFADHVPDENSGVNAPGLAWFCPEHAGPARTLATDLPRSEALSLLRQRYLAGELERPRRWFGRRRA